MVIAIALTLLLMLTLPSCSRQPELCFAHDAHRSPLEVSFDWSLDPDADPETMSLYLFPDDGSPSLRYEFTGRDGARIMVPSGTYTAIAVNSDNENVRLINTDRLETFEVRLRDAYELQGLAVRSSDIPRAPGTENERIASEPARLWRARVNDVTVSDDPGTVSRLTVAPEDAVCHYSVTITSVSNLRGVHSVSATVSGMAGSIFLHDYSLSDEPVTMTFDISPSDQTSLSGNWTTFGHCGHSRSKARDGTNGVLHKFTVYAVLKDGTQWYHTYDVTSHIHSSLLPNGDCDIRLDSLALPEAMSNGGGMFDISIGGWVTISEDIKM